MKTFKKTLISSSISALTLASSISVQAQSMDDLIKSSSVDISFRVRSESVDVDNDSTDSALALSLIHI